METHLRSVVKGMSWRVIATLVTTTVVWFISGEVSMALFAGLSDSIVKDWACFGGMSECGKR